MDLPAGEPCVWRGTGRSCSVLVVWQLGQTKTLPVFCLTGYLLLGLIAMLVVLETFCELHELKKFRKMFYVKKDKDEDQVHIMEHDQLSFSSITEQVAGLKEEQKQNEPFVASQSTPYEDGSANH